MCECAEKKLEEIKSITERRSKDVVALVAEYESGYPCNRGFAIPAKVKYRLSKSEEIFTTDFNFIPHFCPWCGEKYPEISMDCSG